MCHGLSYVTSTAFDPTLILIYLKAQALSGKCEQIQLDSNAILELNTSV